MAINTVQLWTLNLQAADIEISFPTYSFTTISIIARNSQVEVRCNGIANGVPSQSIYLNDGQSLTIDAGNGNIIEYVYINATDIAEIIAR